MFLEELKISIEALMAKKIFSGKILLDGFGVVDESSRRTSAYQADNYAQFYHHLGTLISPKSLIKVGFGAGLPSGCFLRTCKSVEHFFAFREKTTDFYSPRIGRSNVRNFYQGEFEFSDKLATDKHFDIAIVHEENCLEHLNFLWSKLYPNGLICVEYVGRDNSYFDFCKGKGYNPIVVNTHYGVGLIKKEI